MFSLLCTCGSHDVIFLLLFGRDAVSLPSLIDFNTKLLMLKTVWDVQVLFRLLLTYFSCIFWWCHSFLVFGIFNCFNKADDPSLSWYKAIFFSLWNSLVGFSLGMLWSAIYWLFNKRNWAAVRMSVKYCTLSKQISFKYYF